MPDEGRTRNRRGEGERLRPVLVDAASALLAESGSEEGVTLRAIARRAGVTAPAIYAHFDNAKDVLLAAIEQAFEELADVLDTAAESSAHPQEQLARVGSAYLDFAASRPHHYRVMFQRHRGSREGDPVDSARTVETIVGARAFDVLVRAVRAAGEGDADPVRATTRWWIGLHGQASLQQSLPWFPWPPAVDLAHDLRRRLLD